VSRRTETDHVTGAWTSFNPVLGFLSVSTLSINGKKEICEFQSRAGFSECLDAKELPTVQRISVSIPCWVF